MSAAISLRAASAVRGGRTIWSDSTFDLPEGGVVAVIGPNGSGKTTLLEMVLGLLEPASGTIEVLGGHPHRGDRRIGYVPQNYTASVAEAIRCVDLVSLGIAGSRWGLRRLRPDERERVKGALRAVGADDVATHRLARVSGGQQQRVAIAQSLVDEPRLLLLDEPLANLDVRNQREIVDVLARLTGETGVTIVVVVHDLNPLLPVLSGAVYLLDGHAHYGALGDVVDGELLSHLYGTAITVVRTAQGDLFTRSGPG